MKVEIDGMEYTREQLIDGEYIWYPELWSIKHGVIRIEFRDDKSVHISHEAHDKSWGSGHTTNYDENTRTNIEKDIIKMVNGAPNSPIIAGDNFEWRVKYHEIGNVIY